MKTKAKLITGNYYDVYSRLGTVLPFFQDSIIRDKNRATTHTAIMKDINRMNFIGDNDDATSFKDKWLHQHTKYFMQGDHCVSSIPRVLFQVKLRDQQIEALKAQRKEAQMQAGEHIETLTEAEQIEAIAEAQDIETIANDEKHIDFAYFNSERQASGCSLSFYQENPKLWVLATVNNANAHVSVRDVNVYMSEELHTKLGTPKAKDVIFEDDLERHIHKESVLRWAQNSIQDGKVTQYWDDFRPKPFGQDKSIFSDEEYNSLWRDTKNLCQNLPAQREQMLELLKELAKIHDEAIRLENSEGEQKFAPVLNRSTQQLTAMCKEFLRSSPEEQAQNRREFVHAGTALINQSQKSFKYENLSQVALVNCALFILTLGVFYLAAGAIKLAMTGNFLLFSPINKNVRKLEPIREQILALSDEPHANPMINQ